MAARVKRLIHDKETRERIRVGQLVNRLRDHGLGIIELSQSQVRAIEILLRKVLPDLAAVEHSGDVQTSYVVRMPASPVDLDDWRKTNTDPTVTH